jgi:hypothetical protein
MQGRGAKRRCGFAVAAVALTCALVATALALPAGANTKAQTKPAPATSVYRGGAKPKLKPAAAAAAKRRALAKRKAAAKRAAFRRRAAAAAAARRAAAKNKKSSSSLSLPTLALLAIIPFLLMGVYLLVSDYLRRRVPRKRSASLVITRVSDR